MEDDDAVWGTIGILPMLEFESTDDYTHRGVAPPARQRPLFLS